MRQKAHDLAQVSPLSPLGDFQIKCRRAALYCFLGPSFCGDSPSALGDFVNSWQSVLCQYVYQHNNDQDHRPIAIIFFLWCPGHFLYIIILVVSIFILRIYFMWLIIPEEYVALLIVAFVSYSWNPNLQWSSNNISTSFLKIAMTAV